MSIIAIAGKGGVGKTTISSMILKWFINNQLTPVLAMDADSNSNLHEMLGINFTASVGGIREETRKLIKLDPGISKQEYLELQLQKALVEKVGYDFLAMGRPEGPGCYCYANNVLRDVISKLASGYRFLIIDCEAGLEHISRRTIFTIDYLITISDPSIRGLHTAAHIAEALEEMKTRVRHRSLIVNKFRAGEQLSAVQLETIANYGFETIHTVPLDDAVTLADEKGQGIASIGENSLIYKAIDTFLKLLLK